MRNILWTSALFALATSSVSAQLQVTEIMFNSVQEPKWEWVEVRNPTGADIDLDGYIFDDDDGAIVDPNIVSIANGGMSANTIVPAGGLAVFYNGGNLNFEPQRFRNVWSLDSSVSLIGIQSPPSLSNGGDQIGLWTPSGYLLDQGDPDGDGVINVTGFTNSVATVNYDGGNGFPNATDASIYWNGNGSFTDGANWLVANDGTDGARTSLQTFTTMTQINDSADTGNAGLVPAGAAASGLLISEIMYNPASPEADWEWIEVYNNTGATIDFAATPYVLDDDDSGPLAEENITSGSIADGETAVLYNAVISAQNVQDALTGESNFIPVSSWSGLSNGGDSIGIWSNFSDYTTDEADSVFDNAVATVTYTDDPDFPADNGTSSIYLNALDADPTNGFSWNLSDPGDGLSYNHGAAIDSQEDHPGGDVGSPGFFGTVPPSSDGDFNDDGVYDCADIDALVADIVAGNNTASFDLTGDGTVDQADLSAWLVEGGTATIGAAFLDGDATLDGVVDVSDFAAWNSNKFTSTGAWCQGDFNADGVTDVGDFGIWNSNKFTSSSDAAAVPEPSGLALVAFGILGLFAVRRRG